MLKNKIIEIIENRVDSADINGTPEGIAEEILELIKTKYIIQDWTGRRLFLDKEFDSFEDGWNYIYENVDNSTYDQTQNQNDNVYQEYYVVVKPNV